MVLPWRFRGMKVGCARDEQEKNGMEVGAGWRLCITDCTVPRRALACIARPYRRHELGLRSGPDFVHETGLRTLLAAAQPNA